MTLGKGKRSDGDEDLWAGRRNEYKNRTTRKRREESEDGCLCVCEGRQAEHGNRERKDVTTNKTKRKTVNPIAKNK